MKFVTQSDMQQLVVAFAAYLREERMLTEGTIKRYAAVMENFATFLGGVHSAEKSFSLDAVSKGDLLTFMRRKVAEGSEPSRATWNNRLAALRSFYDYLFRQEVIDVNPALRLERLRLTKRERLPLSFDETLSLVDTARDRSPRAFQTRNVAIVDVFFHCALRVAEVVSINLDQVDFDNRLFLNVRTKGNKRLSILFNDVVAEALERYLSDREKLGVPPDETALFVSHRRRRMSVRAVQNLIKDYAARAGISRPVTPHLLRHSSATQLAELGTPLRVVQEICGHASVTTTERYVHPNGNQRREALDELGATWNRHARARRRGNKKPPDEADKGEQPTA